MAVAVHVILCTSVGWSRPLPGCPQNKPLARHGVAHCAKVNRRNTSRTREGEARRLCRTVPPPDTTTGKAVIMADFSIGSFPKGHHLSAAARMVLPGRDPPRRGEEHRAHARSRRRRAD